MKKVCSMLTALVLAGVMSLTSFAITLPVDPADLTGEQIAALLPEDGNGFLKSDALSDCESSDTVTDGNPASAASVLVGDSVAVNFGRLVSINFMDLIEVGHNLRGYRLDAWNGAEWVRIYQNDLANGYYGATFDTVLTSAVRLTVTSLASATAAAIGEMRFTYQPPVAVDHEVLNVGYVTPSTYFHHWDSDIENGKGQELFTRLTDVVLTDLFLFDESGAFDLQIQNRLTSRPEAQIDALTGTATVNGEPVVAYDAVESWLQSVRDCAGTAEDPARFWFNLRYYSTETNSQAFLDSAICEKLVGNVVEFCKLHGFAGVDVSWEYPTTSEGWDSFDHLIVALAQGLHEEGLKLSSRQLPTTGLSDASLQSLDYLNVVAYHQINADGSEGYHHATYHTAVDLTDYFLTRGVEAGHLVLGNSWSADSLPAGSSSTSWKSVFSMAQQAAGEAVEPGQNIFLTDESGSRGWSCSGPYLTADKAAYVLRRGLGGIFCPDVSQDIADKNSAYSLSYQTDQTLRRFTAQNQP